MNLILVLVTCYLSFIQIIDSKKYLLVLDDEFYPYTLQKNVPTIQEYYNLGGFTFEKIDDDKVKLVGTAMVKKSVDPIWPFQLSLQSQFRENSIWKEGPVKLFLPNVCAEFLNPVQFWYNVTKLWTACPPRKGDIWMVEEQIVHFKIELPPSFSKGPWRGYLLFTQGLSGAVSKFGVMFQLELDEVV